MVDKPGFSGKTGVVSDFDEDSGRYEVDLQLTPGGRVTRVSFRGRNLEAVVQPKPQAPPPVPEAEPAPESSPELVKDKDYIVNVKSSTHMVLTRTSSGSWRPEPGPLKLKRINTGAGETCC